MRNLRCPRCQGFLFGSVFRYGDRYREIWKDVLHCVNCGRNWRVHALRSGIYLESFSHNAVKKDFLLETAR